MPMPSRIWHPSPNISQRAMPPDMIVLHYTGMQSGQAALARLCDPAAKVSAHYLVEEDGRIAQLVAEENRAHHAGVSFWGGVTDCNSASIGIEIVNPGHEWGYRPFPAAQMQALQILLAEISTRWAIQPERVLGHSDIAPHRKEDPGELFDWRSLARAGLAVWPCASPGTVTGAMSKARFARAAGRAGYGYLDLEGGEVVLRAFRRRFRPGRLEGALDAVDISLVEALAARWPVL